MNRFILRQSLLLLLTATIWGVAFVAQSASTELIGPFTFNAVRNIIGAGVLVPVIVCMNGKQKKLEIVPKDSLWILGGICCGVILFVASNLQQIGIQYTTAGKAGFVTAMYIVIVPLLGTFFHKKIGKRTWIAVSLAVTGLYLLCVSNGMFILQKGDFLVFCCSVVFSVHILVIDYFAPKTHGVKMSCVQFFVCAILSGICMILWEEPEWGRILEAWLPILYAGALSCGVAYTLQIVGQKGMNPTVASLILSLESVIAVLAGWAILGEKLSGRELVGCVLMFGAIVLVQLKEE